MITKFLRKVKNRMKNIYKNTPRFREKLAKLPKIWLVGCWAHYGVREFPFSRKFKQDKFTKQMVPLVWDYYDCNGACDEYHLQPITNTTTGCIICWTESEAEACKIAEALNILNALEQDLLKVNDKVADKNGLLSIVRESIQNINKRKQEVEERIEKWFKDEGEPQ